MVFADIGRVQPDLFRYLAALVDGIDEYVGGGLTRGLVAVGEHLTGGGIGLRMRRECQAGEAAAEIVFAAGRQGVRVDLVGSGVLLGRKELARMHHGCRVGHRTAQAAYRRIVTAAVAVDPEQLLSGLLVRQVAGRLDKAALVVHAAIREPEHRNVPVGAEGYVVRVLRRIGPVTTQPIEGPPQVPRDLPLHLTITDFPFEPQCLEEIATRVLIAKALDHFFPRRRAGDMTQCDSNLDGTFPDPIKSAGAPSLSAPSHFDANQSFFRTATAP